LAELKEAGIGRKEARGVGVVVDHRRRNLSEEGKKVNVERLNAYKARLIVFPRKAGKPKKGDSSVSELFLLLSGTAIQ
jgi:large subunit ribosomal protein L13e